MMMEVLRTSEMTVYFNENKLRYTPEARHIITRTLPS
jgi:hypothetical protein